MNFTSDNTSPAAPEIMDALLAENTGYATPYGEEAAMENVRDTLRKVFEAPDAAVYLAATGTAANCLILSSLTQPWQRVFCHRHSHVENDECGAPEFFTGGAKMHLLDGEHGKISPDTLAHAIENAAPNGVHNMQAGCVSLTSVNELGAVYGLQELRALCAVAKRAELPVHLDGARFANALVALGCTPAEMSWKCGIDAVSFGATKNGCLGVEAVIFFDPRHAWEFELRRKRSGHLFSKHRFLSAQMRAYLNDDLWLRLARHANDSAAILAKGILAKGGVLHHPAQANMLFCGFSPAAHRRARDKGATYYPFTPATPADSAKKAADKDIESARLICTWATSKTEIDDFLECL